MPIIIEKVGDRYSATLTPPHLKVGDAWETSQPLPLDELVERLREQGCHQTDIGDALYDADGRWE